MSPLVMVRIVAFRIATSCAASMAGATMRAAPSACPMSVRIEVFMMGFLVEASLDEHVLDGADEGILAVDHQEIGELAYFHRADLRGDAEQRGRRDRHGPERIVGAHPRLD